MGKVGLFSINLKILMTMDFLLRITLNADFLYV
jgi:hypothetical protein